MHALMAAQCGDILEKLPKGMDTMIGTEGTYLSGGEQQRVALARAILKDAPIVVLDEATAFADPENEALIQKAFAQLTKGRTVIMIGDGVNDSPALSEADAGIAISTGAAIAREIADITIASEDLFELVTLRKLSTELMARIRRNYRFIVSFNFSLIVLGVAGILPPTTSALLHNTSTLAISIKSMTNLLPEKSQAHESV